MDVCLKCALGGALLLKKYRNSMRASENVDSYRLQAEQDFTNSPEVGVENVSFFQHSLFLSTPSTKLCADARSAFGTGEIAELKTLEVPSGKTNWRSNEFSIPFVSMGC